MCVWAVTHRPSQVNEFLSHLDNKVVFGDDGAVQAFIKLYQLTVHLSYLQCMQEKHRNIVVYLLYDTQ